MALGDSHCRRCQQFLVTEARMAFRKCLERMQFIAMHRGTPKRQFITIHCAHELSQASWLTIVIDLRDI